MPPTSRRRFARVRALVGLDELLLLVGVGLMLTGLWPTIGVGALVVPGVVLVWIALPSRSPLLERPPDSPSVTTRRKG